MFLSKDAHPKGLEETSCYMHRKAIEVIYSLIHYVFGFVFGLFWCCHVCSLTLPPSCSLKCQRFSMWWNQTVCC